MNHEFPVQELMSRLQGKVCWYTLAGKGTGSIVQLYLGDKVPRRTPIRNDKLPASAREFDPEYSLLVYCAWRLDGATQPITSWREPEDNDGPMVRGLAELHGETIQAVEVLEPAWDLFLRFTGGKTFRVFCDRAVFEKDDINWFMLGQASFCITVKQGSLWDLDDDSGISSPTAQN